MDGWRDGWRDGWNKERNKWKLGDVLPSAIQVTGTKGWMKGGMESKNEESCFRVK